MKTWLQFKRMRSRSTLALLAAAIIPLAVVIVILYIQGVEDIKQKIISKLEAVRDLKVQQVNAWLDERIADVSVCSADREIQEAASNLTNVYQPVESDPNVQEIQYLLNLYIKSYEVYSDIFVISAKTGIVVGSADKSHLGEDRSDDISFTEPKLTQKIYVMDIYFSPSLGKPTMDFSAPIFDKNGQGEIVGILVAQVGLERSFYDLLLNRTGMGETGETLIVNRDVVAINELRWHERAPLKLKITAQPAVLAAQGKTGIIEVNDYRGELVLAAYTHIDRMKWGFVAKQDLAEVYAPIRRMMFHFLLIFVIAVAAAAVFSFILAGEITRPVLEMAETSSRFQKGELSARNRIDRPDEIGYLARSFNSMADFTSLQMNIEHGSAVITESALTANELSDFSQKILETLMPVTESCIGAYYTRSRDGEIFEPAASIGATKESMQPFYANALEGEFGAVITTKKIGYIANIPDDTRFTFKTIAGTALPKEIVAIPLLVEKEIAAIISLASLKTYSDEHRKILDRSWIGLNTALANLIANDKTRRLAEELARMNHELQLQTEEMQQQARELEEQSQELQAQQTQVVEADRLKSEFLSNMSHELRTPLNSILALSELMSTRGAGKNPEKDAEYIRIIERNGRHLLNLINDILDLSRIEAGRMKLAVDDFDPRQTVERVVETLRPLAEDKKLKMLSCADDLPKMYSDEDKIHQILINLVSNAIKFTQEGQVELLVETKDENISFIVKDTGLGISEKDIPFIFDQFRQVDGSTTRKYEGTGLGLAICRRLARLLGGDIHVRSELGKGSVFTLVLPLWNNEISQLGFMAIPKQNASTPVKVLKRKVLIVDDEMDICELLRNHLIKAGYEAAIARNGREALRLAHELHPFAITLDVLMPDMDGWEVLSKLKASKATADIPVIVISVSDDKETGVALGAVGSIVKPVVKEQLLGELERLSRLRTIRSVLVVDDDPIAREHLKSILIERQYAVETASRGDEALDIASKRQHDAMLLDLMMPDMDGFAVLDRLRNDPATHDLPVIVVTAKDLTPGERSRLKDAARRIITKGSMNRERLLDEIEAALAELELCVPAKTALDGRRILIVEDNEVAALQIRSALEDNGYETAVARNGAEGLEAIRRAMPNAVVLDLMMPEVDGFAVLEQIRSTPETAELPVLVLTAKELTPEEKRRLKHNHIQELIQKGTLNRAELAARVGQLLKPPSAPLPPPKIAAIQQAPTICQSPRSEKIILAVEDNRDNMFTITEMLDEMGCKYLKAEDGRQGVNMAREAQPDLILMDIQLPELNGLDAIKQIKAIPELARIPIVAMTAKAMKGDRETILAAGCDDYISKPLDAKEAMAMIRKWLG